MTAEIIAVGSEMLTPQKTDTNSLWLTDQLNLLGVDVTQKTVIGDDQNRLAAAIASALDRTPLVLLTGGLGPTEDDLTREATAQALNRALIHDPAILHAIEQRFASFGRKMAPINKRQAFLVDGAVKLDNPNGTAPGQWLDFDGRMLALLPGPPGEMKPLFLTQVLPRLQALLPPRVLRTRFFRVAGMGESDVDQLIAPAYKPYENPVTTILAAAGDIQIHLRSFCATEAEAEARVAELGAKIEALLGDRIYSRNGDPLETALGVLLRERKATLAVAESCTGGLLGGRITEAPGSSEWFLGGFQVYGRAMKTRLLGLDEKLVEREGVVSEAVAVAMAESARDRTGATYALSVTGEAGPDSATPGIEPGTVWIGVATPEGVEAKLHRFPGNRARVRAFAVQSALNLLRLRL
ncbi:MAG: competence/damage-inducible protein A [Bryobacteraceae bacterium]|nr:competence/damage-inducible protein A [Bryobacteraceae bacterium]